MPKKAEKAKPMSRLPGYGVLRKLTADEIIDSPPDDIKKTLREAVTDVITGEICNFVKHCFRNSGHLTELELLIMCEANNLFLDSEEYQQRLKQDTKDKHYLRVLYRLRLLRVLLDRRLAER